MGSDKFLYSTNSASSEPSLRSFLLNELQKAKERLTSTPHPYCELDCTWLVYCRRVSPPGCILCELIDSSLWAAFLSGSSQGKDLQKDKSNRK